MLQEGDRVQAFLMRRKPRSQELGAAHEHGWVCFQMRRLAGRCVSRAVDEPYTPVLASRPQRLGLTQWQTLL